MTIHTTFHKLPLSLSRFSGRVSTHAMHSRL